MPLTVRFVTRLNTGGAKLAWQTDDRHIIESVCLHKEDNARVSVSTQVGCKMACRYCPTNSGPFIRDLTSGEIIGQMLGTLAHISAGARLVAPRRVLLTGGGEPLDNYRQVLDCLNYLATSRFFASTAALVGTCGIVPAVERIARDAPFVELCISLHASNDDVRSFLMAAASPPPLQDVLRAAEHFATVARRVVLIKYMLLPGINDSPAHASELATLMRGRPFRLEIVHSSPLATAPFTGTTGARALEFRSLVDSPALTLTTLAAV